MSDAQELLQYRPEPRPEQHLDVLRLGHLLMEICENQGWRCRIEPGPWLWREAITGQDGWLNPTFDPGKSDVDDSNTASVVITDDDGTFVACNAVRLFETDSFDEVMRSGRLFYSAKTRFLTPLPVSLPAGHPDLRGRIAYSGGTLVDPAWRGKRLGLLTTRLVRLIGERFYRADYHTGHIFQNRPEDPHPRAPYHFMRCVPCLPYLRIPDRDQAQLLFLVEITREEFLDQAARNVAALLAEGHQTLDDLAVLCA